MILPETDSNLNIIYNVVIPIIIIIIIIIMRPYVSYTIGIYIYTHRALIPL